MMKKKAVQVDEKKENERQSSEALLNRSDHQRSLEEEFLRKEPFFLSTIIIHTQLDNAVANSMA